MANALHNLPTELARNRVLSFKEGAEFVGYSVVHMRRLVASGLAPKPVKLGSRKLGFRVGSLIDWIAAATEKAAA